MEREESRNLEVRWKMYFIVFVIIFVHWKHMFIIFEICLSHAHVVKSLHVG